MQTLGSRSIMFCDCGLVYVIFLNTGMLCLFGVCVLKTISSDPQHLIYSWQLESFILLLCYHLKNKQENSPKPNQPRPNKIQTTLNINGESEGVQFIGACGLGPSQASVSMSSHCVCRGLQTGWLC